MESSSPTPQRHRPHPAWHVRLRSWIRYGTSVRAKLITLVLVVACVVVGALYWSASVSLRSSISGIYEQRARSVAAIISKSIEEKDYILYYSEQLDADIERLLERYASVVGITVVGESARGFLTVAGTDPTRIGLLATEPDQNLFTGLRSVEVTRTRIGGSVVLRAYHPVFVGPDLVGVVIVDMSLAEQARFITQLSWQFGAASIIGFLVLGGLLTFALRIIATKPVERLADAMGSVAKRDYEVEISVPFRRLPGTRARDEVGQLIDGFNLMTKVIHSHEQELKKLVVLDELTGAYTTDHLQAELERELNKTRRYKHPTSLLLVDIGGIESRSREERDDVLIRTANFLVGNLRNVDVLFRVGALRFASLLAETPPDGAAIAAERLRVRLSDITSPLGFPVTVTIAPVGWSGEDAPSVDEVIAKVVGSPEGQDE